MLVCHVAAWPFVVGQPNQTLSRSPYSPVHRVLHADLNLAYAPPLQAHFGRHSTALTADLRHIVLGGRVSWRLAFAVSLQLSAVSSFMIDVTSTYSRGPAIKIQFKSLNSGLITCRVS